MSVLNGACATRVGIDFDNTLVCYDELFARLAEERGLLDFRSGSERGQAGAAAHVKGVPSSSASKRSVRDRLRAAGREAEWTELQALAYGPRIDEAFPFAGARAFLDACVARGIEAYIVSHKTRWPYAEPRSDLRAAALGWLRRHAIAGAPDAPLAADRVFFESTRAAKIARIAALGCTHFVDDLVEFLAEPDLPPRLLRILFEPAGSSARAVAEAAEHGPCVRARSWADVARVVFGSRSSPAARHP